MSVTGLFPPEEGEALREYHRALYASEVKEHFFERELHFVHGRSGIFENSISRVEIPGQAPQMLCILRDVTELKRNAEELARAKEAAEAANRELIEANRNLEETGRLAREMADRAEALSAAKSDFLANMTHEVRTPLNGILGMTGLALETQLQADQREYLELVKSSAEALLSLVNDVLDFSKYEVGKLALDCVDFSLRALMRDVLRPMALRASVSGLIFESIVEDQVPDRLVGDPLRIGQVLRNLAGNAIKFTNEGKVTVRVRAESMEGSKITLCFSVSDTGIGVAPEKHQLIFEPFTQADGSTTRKYGGTGLGLSISSGLVELMEGRIWLERSRVGARAAPFAFALTLELATHDAPPWAKLYCRLHSLEPARQKKTAHPGGGGQQREPTPGRASAGARGTFGNDCGLRARGVGCVRTSTIDAVSVRPHLNGCSDAGSGRFAGHGAHP